MDDSRSKQVKKTLVRVVLRWFNFEEHCGSKENSQNAVSGLRLELLGLVCAVGAFACTLCVFAGETQRSSLDSQSHDLAAAFLRVNNTREGIEYMGGPFLLEDYTEGGWRDRRYNYNRPLGLEAHPDWFDIDFTFGADADLKGKLNRPISEDTLPILEKVAGVRTKEICRALADAFQVSDPADEKEPLQIVEIDENGIMRSYPDRSIRLYSARKFEDGSIQLIFLEIYTPKELRWDLGDVDVYIEKRDDEWEPVTTPDEPFEIAGSSGRSDSSREKFFLRGQIEKVELRKIVEIVQRAPSREKIFAVTVRTQQELKDMAFRLGEPLSQGVAFAHLGPRRHCGLPKHALTLAPKGDSWQVVGTASLSYVEVVFGVESGATLSFTARPSKEEVQALRQRLRWAGSNNKEARPYENLSESDLLEICEMSLRIKGLVPHDPKVFSRKQGEAEISQFWMGGGDTLELKKLGGVWRITNAIGGVF